jgi:hypothetical protein
MYRLTRQSPSPLTGEGRGGGDMNIYTHNKGNKRASETVARVLWAALLMAVFVSEYCYAAEAVQETFSSPDEAFQTMVAALEAGNDNQLKSIFGPDEKDIISQVQGAGKETLEQFLKAYEERNTIEIVHEEKAVLYVGKKEWPWPVPVIKVGGRWQFDTKGGKEEILARHIGQNEIAAVQVCLAYVDAQEEYAQNHRAHGLAEYAEKLVNQTGKDKALCSTAKQAEETEPLGPLIAGACEAEASGSQSAAPARPYHGYFYKILKKQGPNARGGAYDYMVNGMMVGGFALIAYPAFYQSSGIMTFIVNQDAVVYQKDLGKDTEKTAEAMTTFDPDPSWTAVD